MRAYIIWKWKWKGWRSTFVSFLYSWLDFPLPRNVARGGGAATLSTDRCNTDDEREGHGGRHACACSQRCCKDDVAAHQEKETDSPALD